jgi:hypothetical protein
VEHRSSAAVAPEVLSATVSQGLWIEPGMALMWTARDNGTDLNGTEAARYCEALSLGGLRDWWLPAITDLARIYDPAVKGHARGGIQLSMPWVWSISQPENPHPNRFIPAWGYVWDLSFKPRTSTRRTPATTSERFVFAGRIAVQRGNLSNHRAHTDFSQLAEPD